MKKPLKRSSKPNLLEFFALIAVGAFVLFATAPVALAATSGPNNGSTFVSDSSIGTQAWSNPGNAQTSNDNRSIANMDSGNIISRYLKATGFGFSIPTGATIDGIEVKVERRQTGGGFYFKSI